MAAHQQSPETHDPQPSLAVKRFPWMQKCTQLIIYHYCQSSCRQPLHHHHWKTKKHLTATYYLWLTLGESAVLLPVPPLSCLTGLVEVCRGYSVLLLITVKLEVAAVLLLGVLEPLES